MRRVTSLALTVTSDRLSRTRFVPFSSSAEKCFIGIVARSCEDSDHESTAGCEFVVLAHQTWAINEFWIRKFRTRQNVYVVILVKHISEARAH